jgi:predicted RNA-binding Zn ribbon-like protein
MGNMANSQDKKVARRRAPKFELTAGVLCLDFVNTLDGRSKPEPKELLKHYVDLARFGEDTGILSPQQTDRLFALSSATPEPAQRVLQAAIQMREAMYEIFSAKLDREPVPAAALFTLNQYLQMAAQHARLVPVNGLFEWRFEEAPNNLEAPLWPIARSAAELLASEQLAYVRACAADTCQWLFLDSSKNHGRRWCDMKSCGNRAKFRRFYKRKNKRASTTKDAK